MGKKLTYQQFLKYVLVAISILAVVLHVGNYTILGMQSVKFYAWHVMIGISLIYLYYPLEKIIKKDNLKIMCRVIDWICVLAVVVISAYVILHFEAYMQMMQNNMPSAILYVFGLVLTLLVLEAGRRTLGPVLPIIALLAIVYALFGGNLPGLFGHRGYNLRRVVSTVFGDQGIYGTATATCASNVYLFLLFAAYLNASGADMIFQDIAIALAGKKRGGPAKMAVVASAFFGTISGSCVANVVSTGAFTIPLMKRNGYDPSFAGAVEAVSSTGGQIMPPIMGAAAFVLADVAGIPYAQVCIAAFLPAVMYYCCELKMVDLEAVKYNLKGLDPDSIPSLRDSVMRGMKLFVPVIVLLFMMLALGATPMRSAICATAAILIMGFIDKYDRMTFNKVIEGAVACGKTLTSVIAACATAGIVVAIFSLTGLGLKFSNFIVQMGGSQVLVSLILSMLVCAVLGMGLPTTAAYIVCATAIAPALITLGIDKLAAHLFLLYFASLSAITPPVAVASYAAAGLAEENPMKVSMKAVMIGIVGFILPFAFVLNTDYLHFGFDFVTLITWICAFVVCISLACAFQGYVEQKITVIERALYLIVCGLVIQHHYTYSIIGIVIFAVLYGARKIQYKKGCEANGENHRQSVGGTAV